MFHSISPRSSHSTGPALVTLSLNNDDNDKVSRDKKNNKKQPTTEMSKQHKKHQKAPNNLGPYLSLSYIIKSNPSSASRWSQAHCGSWSREQRQTNGSLEWYQTRCLLKQISKTISVQRRGSAHAASVVKWKEKKEGSQFITICTQGDTVLLYL